MHIAVDIDGVCLDFIGALHRQFTRVFGGPVLANFQQTSWDTGPVFAWDEWEQHGYRDAWDWIRRFPTFWGDADPIPGALGALDALKQAGHWLEALTDKPDWAKAQLWRWLERYDPPFDAVTFVPRSQTKAEVSDADVLIDDKPENCLAFARDGRFALLFDQPWNQDAPELCHVWRVYSWDDVLRDIEAIEMEEATAA